MKLTGCFDIIQTQLSGANHEGEIIVIDMVVMTKDTHSLGCQRNAEVFIIELGSHLTKLRVKQLIFPCLLYHIIRVVDLESNFEKIQSYLYKLFLHFTFFQLQGIHINRPQCVKARGQLMGDGSLLLPCRCWGLKLRSWGSTTSTFTLGAILLALNTKCQCHCVSSILSVRRLPTKLRRCYRLPVAAEYMWP